jgi:hypothetical protein
MFFEKQFYILLTATGCKYLHPVGAWRMKDYFFKGLSSYN